MGGLDLAADLIIQFFLFRRLYLRLGQNQIFSGNLGLQSQEAGLELGQIVPQPGTAYAAGRDKNALFAQLVADVNLACAVKSIAYCVMANSVLGFTVLRIRFSPTTAPPMIACSWTLPVAFTLRPNVCPEYSRGNPR